MPTRRRRVSTRTRRGKGFMDVARKVGGFLKKAHDFIKDKKIISRYGTVLDRIRPGLGTSVAATAAKLGYGRRRRTRSTRTRRGRGAGILI